MSLKNNPSYRNALKVTAFIAVMLVLNLLVSVIPEGFITADVTSNKMYTVSDHTKEALKENSEKVELCLIATGTAPNESIRNFLSKYTKVNKNISVRILQTETDLQEISRYTQSPESGSVIVRSEKRSVYLPYSSFFDYSADAESSAYYAYNIYYSNGYVNCSYPEFKELYGEVLGLYDGYRYESEVTDAIKYCISDELKTVYVLQSGDGSGLGYDMTDRIRDCMTELKTLDSTANEIPDDADACIVMAYSDISAESRRILSDYASGGGKILVMNSGMTEKPELSGLCLEMGISLSSEMVFEDNENYCYGGYNALVMPDVSEDEAGKALSDAGANVVMIGATSIGISETLPQGVTVQPLMITSPEAYAKSSVENGFAFEEGKDIRKSHNLAVKAENANGGQLAVVSSAVYIDDEYDIYSDCGNKIFTVSLISQLTGSEESSEIPAVAAARATVEDNGALKAAFAVMCVVFVLIVVFVFLLVKKQYFAGRKKQGYVTSA